MYGIDLLLFLVIILHTHQQQWPSILCQQLPILRDLYFAEQSDFIELQYNVINKTAQCPSNFGLTSE